MTETDFSRRGFRVLSAADIVRRRHLVVIVLRLLSLFWLTLGVLIIISWITEGLSDGDLLSFGYYADRISYAMTFFLAAGVCRFLDRPLARWVVRIPRPECPRCRYRLDQMTHARCPECGLRLSDDAPGDSAEPPDEPPPP